MRLSIQMWVIRAGHDVGLDVTGFVYDRRRTQIEEVKPDAEAGGEHWPSGSSLEPDEADEARARLEEEAERREAADVGDVDENPALADTWPGIDAWKAEQREGDRDDDDC